jgi:hypothetical protein
VSDPRFGATHELNLAHAAIALAWHDAQRDGRTHRLDAACGEIRATVVATCEPGWIAVRASGLPQLDPTDALQWNGALAGGVCFAMNPRGDIEVRAEIALDPEAPLALRLRAVRAGIAGALARVAERAPATSESGPDAPGTSFDAAAVALDAGFAVSARPDGRCAVDLGSGRVSASAEVATHGDGGVAARVALLDRETLEPDSRLALQRFLLRSNAAFRMTRAVLENSGDATRARVEIVFDTAPSDGEWRLALGALAVATRHTQREATALVDDPELARAFLALAPPRRAPHVARSRFDEADVRPWAPNAPA